MRTTMFPAPRRSWPVALLGVLLAPFALATLTACEESPEPGGTPIRTAAPPVKPPSAVYTVRGTVEQLPIEGEPQTEFRVHHEAIDNFKNASGLVVGMNAMSMPFPLGPGVKLDGVAVGDLVELTFAIWWDETAPEYHVTRLRKLTPDTRLEFREARPDLSAEQPRPPSGAPVAPGAAPIPGGR